MPFNSLVFGLHSTPLTQRFLSSKRPQIITTCVFVLVPFNSLVFGLHPVAFSMEFALAATIYLPANFRERFVVVLRFMFGLFGLFRAGC